MAFKLFWEEVFLTDELLKSLGSFIGIFDYVHGCNYRIAHLPGFSYKHKPQD